MRFTVHLETMLQVFPKSQKISSGKEVQSALSLGVLGYVQVSGHLLEANILFGLTGLLNPESWLCSAALKCSSCPSPFKCSEAHSKEFTDGPE